MKYPISTPVWRADRMLPQYRDDELLALANAPETDLSPWAAYTLGYQSRAIGLWHWQMARLPQAVGQIYDEIPVAAARLKLACDILADTLRTGVVDQLRRAIDLTEESNDIMAQGDGANDRGSPTAEGVESVERLPVLADRGIVSEHPLRLWYNMGRGVGDARPAMFGPVSLSHHDHFGRLLGTVHSLPAEHRQRWTSDTDSSSGVALWPRLRAVVDVADMVGSSEMALRDRFLSGREIHFVGQLRQVAFFSEISALALELDAYLRTLARPKPKPYWDGSRLYYEGVLIMSLDRERASASAPILDRFQECGWPEAGVDDPDTHARSTKKGHIETLNDSLIVKRIRFVGNGTKRGIGWVRL